MGARTSIVENFYFVIEIHCTSMYICVLPHIQLLCQIVIIAMPLDHIAINITKLITIARGLEWEPGPRTSKISTFL